MAQTLFGSAQRGCQLRQTARNAAGVQERPVEAQATYTEILRTISSALAAITEAAHSRTVEPFPSLAMVEGTVLDEPGAQSELERALHETGTFTQRLQPVQNQFADVETAIRGILAVRACHWRLRTPPASDCCMAAHRGC